MTTPTQIQSLFVFDGATTRLNEICTLARTSTTATAIYRSEPVAAELSLDAMFELLEQADPRAAAAEEEGTKWVADALFGQAPVTLSTLRMRAGLSQRALAARLGISQPAVAKMERESSYNMKLGTIKNLARALDIEVTELVRVLLTQFEEKEA